VSIAAHALVVAAFVIIPLGAEVEMPQVSSPIKVAQFLRTVVPPSPPPPPSAVPPAPSTTVVPLEAPTSIAPERLDVPSNPVEGAIPDVVGSGPATAGLANVGTTPLPVLAPPPPPPQPKIVRAGYGVREPKKVLHVPPEYPEIAKRARVEGAVVLEAILDVNGRVEQVRVMHSVPLLDDAAVRAVREWRYTPTELNGVPVPVLMTITVRFFLER
jgi:protein TonB